MVVQPPRLVLPDVVFEPRFFFHARQQLPFSQQGMSRVLFRFAGLGFGGSPETLSLERVGGQPDAVGALAGLLLNHRVLSIRANVNANRAASLAERLLFF